MTKFTEKHSPDEYSGFPAAFTEAELDVLTENETVLKITEVRVVDSKYGSAYAVSFLTDSGAREKLFSQGSIEGRDQLLDDVAEFLAGGDDREPVAVRLERWGRGIGLVPVQDGDWGEAVEVD